MVLTAYFVLSPVTGLFCHRRFADHPQNLTPASGRQRSSAGTPNQMRPRGLERLFNGLLPRYADIGKKPVVEFEKLPALVPSLAGVGNSVQP
jgi:hypothetical protein